MKLPLIDCQHWEDGRCKVGHHNGRPAAHECKRCVQRLPLPGSTVRSRFGEIPSDYDPKKGWKLNANGTAGCGCAS